MIRIRFGLAPQPHSATDELPAWWKPQQLQPAFGPPGQPAQNPLARERYTCEQRYTPGCSKLTVVGNDGGGLITKYMEIWQRVEAAGYQVKVLGACVSACTLVTSYVSKDRLCFGPEASLQFHMARKSTTDPNPDPEVTRWMMFSYPIDIQDWLRRESQRKNLEIPPYIGFWTLTASDLWKMGYRRCNE